MGKAGGPLLGSWDNLAQMFCYFVKVESVSQPIEYLGELFVRARSAKVKVRSVDIFNGSFEIQKMAKKRGVFDENTRVKNTAFRVYYVCIYHDRRLGESNQPLRAAMLRGLPAEYMRDCSDGRLGGVQTPYCGANARAANARHGAQALVISAGTASTV
jgi:hypothetical protein